ncbi:preprotein translocase subunit SecG [Beijerinckia sp. L45]|uniref:preprotein translocase subunit SecG n=1 Tax=Beijerinckia sp. L45 TaxID=1641855 RepID=UPI00131D30CE|nr:preprotein translocase subunit SecG [Beijerinckia sp. L45]
MQTVLIVVHLMIVIALVAVVLLQRSEGGALGVGGGSGFMTGRGQANVLTRATGILAALFFVTSLSLTVLAGFGHGQRSILDGNAPAGDSTPAAPAALPPKGEGSVLDQLRKIEEQKASQPVAPAPEAPTGPAPPRGQ